MKVCESNAVNTIFYKVSHLHELLRPAILRYFLYTLGILMHAILQNSHHQLHNPNCTKNVVYLWLVTWAAAIKYFGLLMGFYSKWQRNYFSSWSFCISCMGMVSCIFYSNTNPYIHIYTYTSATHSQKVEYISFDTD